MESKPHTSNKQPKQEEAENGSEADKTLSSYDALTAFLRGSEQKSDVEDGEISNDEDDTSNPVHDAEGKQVADFSLAYSVHFLYFQWFF